MSSPPVITVIAFDFGLRQVGAAVGNSQLRTSDSLPVLRARDGVPDWDALQRLVQEWQPDLLVVGDPLNMDGSDSQLCARARRFARQLHGRLRLPVGPGTTDNTKGEPLIHFLSARDLTNLKDRATKSVDAPRGVVT